MFYETSKNDHGLPHNPFKAIVAPRPIGWITSMNAKGETNLAPYSFFNGITDKPPIVMFSSEGPKDSVAFVEETKEFVCSLATFDLRDQMNGTAAPLPRGTCEMRATGLEGAPSRLVKPPRVIGKNTVESLQSGVVYGFAGQVDGVVRGIIAELGSVKAVVATGGLAPIVIDDCATVTHFEPWLTLIGLRLIYERNARSR